MQISVELCMLLSLIGFTSDIEPLVLWVIYDICAVAFTFNAMELTRHSEVPRAVSLTYHMYAAYSLFIGFPLGFSFKLLWIAWRSRTIRFIYLLVPFYVGGVAAGACAIFYLLPSFVIHVVKRCRQGDDTTDPSTTRITANSTITKLFTIVFLFAHFGIWFVVFSNVHICRAPQPNLVFLAEEYTPSYVYPCFETTKTWTVCFLPVTAEMCFLMLLLIWTVLAKGKNIINMSRNARYFVIFTVVIIIVIIIIIIIDKSFNLFIHDDTTTTTTATTTATTTTTTTTTTATTTTTTIKHHSFSYRIVL